MRRRRVLAMLASAIGVWGAVPLGVTGAAAGVPGAGALASAGDAQLISVSCGSAGDCVAGGYYTDASGVEQGFDHYRGFVASQRNGKWGRAIREPAARG